MGSKKLPRINHGMRAGLVALLIALPLLALGASMASHPASGHGTAPGALAAMAFGAVSMFGRRRT
ncbi:hypothetical protein OP10G_1940 [Fimbriimonas ginsengisoli Gsoil 348]|uniref:Uncharacterized protein n=1 Tax=Fimbriimonas ginsengisoli Gsoil 348 TaxID=661478 RepID=A0A068NP18_FIMGI|nr:hypothetical protein OP10G_1940 [Fimbriimonas ginsengisoli Gsoil 348]